MTLQHIFLGLRRYGLRGAVNFVLGYPKRRRFQRKMAKTLITDPSWKPEPGITIIGNLSFGASLSKVLRDLVIRLRDCGIPCQAFDLGCENPIPASEYADLLTPADEFRLNRYSDIIGISALPPLPKTDCRLSRILFWEFESGMCEAWPVSLDPIRTIAMSDFNLSVFRRLLPKSTPIDKILYPFQFKPRLSLAKESVRARYGIAPDDFVVFFNFAYMSSYHRKNPEGAVRAFAEAFGDRPDVRLVFKTMGSELYPASAARLKALVGKLGLADRIVFIETFIAQDELIALTAACDAYVSLHRGEGFGLGVAEAMSLGKPVVVTDYSSTTEFCNCGNAMPIPYEMVDVRDDQRDIPDYRHVKAWAEPDVHAAAAALRKLYENPPFRRELGARAKAFIDDYFSDANFRKSVCAFLDRAPQSAPPRRK